MIGKTLLATQLRDALQAAAALQETRDTAADDCDADTAQFAESQFLESQFLERPPAPEEERRRNRARSRLLLSSEPVLALVTSALVSLRSLSFATRGLKVRVGWSRCNHRM